MTEKNTLCSAEFRFRQPFFQFGNASDPNPHPYVRIKNHPLVVFGILDPALLPQIGEMNYSWVNQDKDLDTHVEIADPREALMQLLQTCDADPDCRGARRILLAQMLPEDVRRLADRLHGQFEAIISASEETHATRDTLTLDRNVAPDTRSPIVLTPASHFFRSSPTTTTGHDAASPSRSDIHYLGHRQPFPPNVRSVAVAGVHRSAIARRSDCSHRGT